MKKQTTVRLPEDLADQAEVIARAQDTSVNQVLIDGLLLEIERVKADQEFMATLERLVARDKEILDRLAQ